MHVNIMTLSGYFNTSMSMPFECAQFIYMLSICVYHFIRILDFILLSPTVFELQFQTPQTNICTFLRIIALSGSTRNQWNNLECKEDTRYYPSTVWKTVGHYLKKHTRWKQGNKQRKIKVLLLISILIFYGRYTP